MPLTTYSVTEIHQTPRVQGYSIEKKKLASLFVKNNHFLKF